MKTEREHVAFAMYAAAMRKAGFKYGAADAVWQDADCRGGYLHSAEVAIAAMDEFRAQQAATPEMSHTSRGRAA